MPFPRQPQFLRFNTEMTNFQILWVQIRSLKEVQAGTSQGEKRAEESSPSKASRLGMYRGTFQSQGPQSQSCEGIWDIYQMPARARAFHVPLSSSSLCRDIFLFKKKKLREEATLRVCVKLFSGMASISGISSVMNQHEETLYMWYPLMSGRKRAETMKMPTSQLVSLDLSPSKASGSFPGIGEKPHKNKGVIC